MLPYYLLSIYKFCIFTDYEDEIFYVTSNLHIQGSKFGGKIKKKIEGKSFKKLNSTEFIKFLFSKSGRV